MQAEPDDLTDRERETKSAVACGSPARGATTLGFIPAISRPLKVTAQLRNPADRRRAPPGTWSCQTHWGRRHRHFARADVEIEALYDPLAADGHRDVSCFSYGLPA